MSANSVDSTHFLSLGRPDTHMFEGSSFDHYCVFNVFHTG